MSEQKYQYKLEIANFIFKVSDKELLDVFEEWFLPILEEGEIEDYSFSETEKLFFHNLKFDIHEGNPVLYGRLVKRATLKSQQDFIDGKLVDDNKELRTHPSSFFVLLLHNHKLLWVKETTRAPVLNDFKRVVKSLFRKNRKDFVTKKLKEKKDSLYREFQVKKFKSGSKEKKQYDQLMSNYREEIHHETLGEIEITPIPDIRELEKRIRALKYINQIKIKLLPTNNETADENNQFLSAFENTSDKLGSNKGLVQFGGEKQHLKQDAVIKLANKTSKGTMETEIIGESSNGESIKFSNTDRETSIKTKISNYLKKGVKDNLNLMFEIFESIVDGKVIAIPKINKSSKDKALSLVKNLNSRFIDKKSTKRKN